MSNEIALAAHVWYGRACFEVQSRGCGSLTYVQHTVFFLAHTSPVNVGEHVTLTTGIAAMLQRVKSVCVCVCSLSPRIEEVQLIQLIELGVHTSLYARVL